MISRKALTVLATVILLLASCGGDKQKKELSFTIQGTLVNAENKMLYIEEMTPDNGPRFLDSIKCDKEGKFKYKGSMDYQTFFNLHCGEYNYIVILPSDGEVIRVAGDANMLDKSYRIEGSPESQLMWQIQNYINDANSVIADLAQQDNLNRETLNENDYAIAHQKTDSLFLAERSTTYMMFYNFIEDHLGSLTTLYAIDAPFNHTNRVFYPQIDLPVFSMVLDGLLEKEPNNPHTQFYQAYVERLRSAQMLQQTHELKIEN